MEQDECDVFISNIGETLTIPSNNGPLINPDKESLGIIENGYIVIKDGVIIEVGQGEKHINAKTFIDAHSGVALPGFIDSHTHCIFGGSRENEFSMRIRGKDYVDIMKEGGGIQSTVNATRNASKEQLFEGASERLDSALKWGTTTCEIKSGYGLTTESEIKMLEVAELLQEQHTVDVIPTFLGAHEIPDEYKKEREIYIHQIINDMIPEVSKRNLARFCDVFCEEGVFDKDESERILKAGLEHGLKAKLHVDELKNIGGCEIAEEVQAVSCDHLQHTDEKGFESMKKAGSIATLLPGTSLFLMKNEIPPINIIREYEVPMSVASDFNPGSSPVISMSVIMSLACLLYKMTPEEVLVGSTINAAYALAEEEKRGSIEGGKYADIVLMNVKHYEEIPYWFAQNNILHVIKNGVVVV
jgi:imidazolonepropionase